LEQEYSLKDSISIVAEKYGRTYSSTRNLYYRYNENPEKEHGNCILNRCEETQLRIILLGLSQNYMSVPVHLVKDIVKSCFGKTVSKKWVIRYIKKRNNELKLRNSKYFPKKRSIQTITNEVEAFIASLKEQTEEYLFF